MVVGDYIFILILFSQKKGVRAHSNTHCPFFLILSCGNYPNSLIMEKIPQLNLNKGGKFIEVTCSFRH